MRKMSELSSGAVTKRFGSISKTPGARVIAVTASLLSSARLHARADVVYRPITLDGAIFFFFLILIEVPSLRVGAHLAPKEQPEELLGFGMGLLRSHRNRFERVVEWLEFRVPFIADSRAGRPRS